MADEHTIRRHNGWEIRNADGLYWHDYEKKWLPVGMRWLGHSRRDMRRMARAVGGTLVRLTLVRRTKAGRSAVRCSECHDTQAEIAALRARVERAERKVDRFRDLVGACRRPIVGTDTWLRAWQELLDCAAVPDDVEDGRDAR